MYLYIINKYVYRLNLRDLMEAGIGLERYNMTTSAKKTIVTREMRNVKAPLVAMVTPVVFLK